jgi:hypothetical protein
MKLEARLRRAGDLLDAASTEYQRDHDRAPTERRIDRSPRRPGPRLVLAAALITVVAAAASIVVLSRGDRPTEVSAGKDDQGRQTDVKGVLVSPRGLFDLETGDEEPLTDVYQVIYDETVAYSTIGPGGDQLFYTSYLEGGPWPGGEPPAGMESAVYRRTGIRVRDLSDGSDQLLADGARSVAVSPSGRIAFARGTEPDDGGGVTHYWSDVMVQGSVDAEPQVWNSEPGEYLVRAWAGDRLIAARWNPTVVADDVVVFDGPGRLRVLATQAVLLALSPDGSTALVDQGDDKGNPHALLLVDVATGVTRTVGVGDPEARRWSLFASWVDDTLVVSKYFSASIETSVYRVTSTDEGPTPVLEKTIPSEVDAMLAHGTWLAGDAQSFTTQFTPRSSADPGPDPVQLLTCTIATGDCEVVDVPLGGEVAVRLSNPSRPLPPGLPVEAG